MYNKYLSADYLAHYGLSLQGDNHPRRARHYAEDKELIDFCLNCKKTKCNGDCTDFKRFRQAKQKGGEE